MLIPGFLRRKGGTPEVASGPSAEDLRAAAAEPLKFGDPRVKRVVHEIADRYSSPRLLRVVAALAGIDPGVVPFDDTPVSQVMTVLEVADAKGLVERFLDIAFRGIGARPDGEEFSAGWQPDEEHIRRASQFPIDLGDPAVARLYRELLERFGHRLQDLMVVAAFAGLSPRELYFEDDPEVVCFEVLKKANVRGVVGPLASLAFDDAFLDAPVDGGGARARIEFPVRFDDPDVQAAFRRVYRRYESDPDALLALARDVGVDVRFVDFPSPPHLLLFHLFHEAAARGLADQFVERALEPVPLSSEDTFE